MTAQWVCTMHTATVISSRVVTTVFYVLLIVAAELIRIFLCVTKLTTQDFFPRVSQGCYLPELKVVIIKNVFGA